MNSINYFFIVFITMGLSMASDSEEAEHEAMVKTVQDFVKKLDDFFELYKKEMDKTREHTQKDDEFKAFEQGYMALHNRTATFASVILTKLSSIKGVSKDMPSELAKLNRLFEETKESMTTGFTKLWEQYNEVLEKRTKEEL